MPVLLRGSIRQMRPMWVKRGAGHCSREMLKQCVFFAKNPKLALRKCFGSFPLHIAASYGHLELVRFLLLYKYPGISVAWVRRLLGAYNPNVPTDCQATPLHIAASHGYEDVMRMLLAYGADPNARDIVGDTPLHEAALCEQRGAAALLLAHAASTTIKNNDGDLPMDRTTDESIRLLLTPPKSKKILSFVQSTSFLF